MMSFPSFVLSFYFITAFLFLSILFTLRLSDFIRYRFILSIEIRLMLFHVCTAYADPFAEI